VEGVRVTKLEENTFYALVTIIDIEDRVYHIDARPSDSIALALKTKAPIYVAEKVMNAASIHPDQMPEAELDQIADLNKKLQIAVNEEQYEEAARLRDKIKELEKKLGVKKNI
jgi:bifunctional DNase/RNase